MLRQHLNDVLEDASNDIAGMARLVLQRAQEHWRELEAHIRWCDRRIAVHQKDDNRSSGCRAQRGRPHHGISDGSTVGDFKQFKNGAQFGAWLGLTPKQIPVAAETSLGGITKPRQQLFTNPADTGAKSIVLIGKNIDDPITQWAQRLREALRLAESRRGARQQERSDSLGRHDREQTL